MASSRSGYSGRLRMTMPRSARSVVYRDFGNYLLQDRISKHIITLRGDDESAGAADHLVLVVAVEVGLEREDRQAVDGDAFAYRFVACERGGTASVVRSVAETSITRRVP